MNGSCCLKQNGTYCILYTMADGCWIWRSDKSIYNAFTMFKYAIQYANIVNSLPNWNFENGYISIANLQGIFRICMTQILIVHQSFGIVHLTYKFILQIFIMCKIDDNLEFLIEFAAIICIFEHYNCIGWLSMAAVNPDSDSEGCQKKFPCFEVGQF